MSKSAQELDNGSPSSNDYITQITIDCLAKGFASLNQQPLNPAKLDVADDVFATHFDEFNAIVDSLVVLQGVSDEVDVPRPIQKLFGAFREACFDFLVSKRELEVEENDDDRELPENATLDEINTAFLLKRVTMKATSASKKQTHWKKKNMRTMYEDEESEDEYEDGDEEEEDAWGEEDD